MKIRFLSVALALALPHMAMSAPVSFFGEDLTPGSMVPAGGAAETARNNFLGALDPGIGVEDFEAPTSLPNIDFPVTSGNVTATLTGGSTTIRDTPTVGAFATSGNNYVLTGGGGDFAVSFTTAISAFGFYATDIGDFGSSLVLRLTRSLASGGGTVDIDVGNTVNANSGSLLFYGFLDVVDTYTSVQFFNEPNANEQFGFDDMIVGDLAQIINPPTVPLPAAGWMLIAGLGAMGAIRRKQRKA